MPYFLWDLILSVEEGDEVEGEKVANICRLWCEGGAEVALVGYLLVYGQNREPWEENSDILVDITLPFVDKFFNKHGIPKFHLGEK